MEGKLTQLNKSIIVLDEAIRVADKRKQIWVPVRGGGKCLHPM